MTVDAFDADVLIYAASPSHELGRRIAQLFVAEPAPDVGDPAPVGVGSVLLLPELLIHPTRHAATTQRARLLHLLARLDLLPVTEHVAALAVVLGAKYGLKPIDAVHLATAVDAGCDRFITNNIRDFDSARIDEIEIVTPATL
jgi:predicted nucleic acid-binding protein